MEVQNEHLEQTIGKVKTIFSEFLVNQKFRRTPERFAILEEIYRGKNHFDAEALYVHMNKMNYRVSRATVYNTLDVLVQCDLVRKHQFGKNLAQFERSYGFKQHDHIICKNCGKVIEFCDPRIQMIKDTMSDIFDMTISDHSLQLFGICKERCKTQQD